MDWIVAIVLAVAALFVGSLLTRVVARVPQGEPVLGAASHCRRCGEPLAVAEQVPVVSWLLLRGRCRTCDAPIPWWYPAVEAATAVLFVLSYLWIGADWLLPAYLYLAALAIVGTAIDLQHHRLPNALTYPSAPIMLALLSLAVLGPGTWGDLGRAALGGAALFVAYFVLALINPSGIGGGDVKLALTLGMVLGWAGWAEVLVGGLAGFFIGAVVGVVLLLTRRAGRKSAIAFGPFMFAGTYVGLAFGQSVMEWYLGA